MNLKQPIRRGLTPKRPLFLSLLDITQAYSQEELDTLKATPQQFLGKVV